jgi:hypothetical protein
MSDPVLLHVYHTGALPIAGAYVRGLRYAKGLFSLHPNDSDKSVFDTLEKEVPGLRHTCTNTQIHTAHGQAIHQCARLHCENVCFHMTYIMIIYDHDNENVYILHCI